MRILFVLISIFFFGSMQAQIPKPGDLYKKIENYYRQNPNRLEFVHNIHKNLLRFDTITLSFAYLPLAQKGYYLFWVDSNFSVTGGILLSEEYYVVNANLPEKIFVKKNELNGTMNSRLNDIPGPNSTSFATLMTRFGHVKSIAGRDDKYIAVTQKSILEIDTFSFRITKLTETVPYKGKIQYNEFQYWELPDSIQNSIREQAIFLVEEAKNFPVTTFKELEKRKAPLENFEGKQFAFKNLVSYNKGPLDSFLNGRYVILDFFYQACMPCHKMTGYILDWLPTVDSSKIILIGVNPTDSEKSMKLFVERRNINYPIIIGQQAKEIAKKYVPGGYPTLLLIAPDGTIRNLHIGMSKSFLTKAEKIISQ